VPGDSQVEKVETNAQTKDCVLVDAASMHRGHERETE